MMMSRIAIIPQSPLNRGKTIVDGFGYSVDRKHAALIDKLVFLAGGSIDLVQEAIMECAGDDGSPLENIVDYLVKQIG